ncbi:AbrB/MazE/SpoVT family DNA-binding domain-containing protein [Pistricoccus aurantiacus]|uniref:AbrB/MazE/SpoVT family DNA-binding domain-containing protein n=1 Tax=Pistricoccus aurantiacus TaxID=1883414 RepID=A0A5B8SU39_9GAMM|nr:AbrB/MazE/SpoVT family DNA-binding domain-containing protein [Pistricoccus aurantiacus]QEA38280.1 AbrB/MazE/SpoVT family DNA-binding domain-containing protein [Pistricoccus aurantiacus]
MVTATVTTKGQVTIPAQVRATLGLSAGDRVEFVPIGEGKYAIMAATYSVKDLKGMIRKPRAPVSVEDMNAAIASQGAKAR